LKEGKGFRTGGKPNAVVKETRKTKVRGQNRDAIPSGTPQERREAKKFIIKRKKAGENEVKKKEIFLHL